MINCGGSFPAARASRFKCRSMTMFSNQVRVAPALSNPLSKVAQAIHLASSFTSKLLVFFLNSSAEIQGSCLMGELVDEVEFESGFPNGFVHCGLFRQKVGNFLFLVR